MDPVRRLRYSLEDYTKDMGRWFYVLEYPGQRSYPEGDKEQWQAIYVAILGNTEQKFKRLAVAPTCHGCKFWSPRNRKNRKDVFHLHRSEYPTFLALLDAAINGTFINRRTEDRTEGRHGDIAYDCPTELP
jgi:hypothetical protein